MVPTVSPTIHRPAQSAETAASRAIASAGQRLRCRSCGGGSFGDVIDLGSMPLVNHLLKRPDDSCPRWPLKVVFCRECSLAQLTQAPPPEAMFSEYVYFSSQSQTMVAHAAELVARFVKSGQRVLEIASNDGYLLRQAQPRGAIVLGVDPARNVAQHANDLGVPTRCDFFNAEIARDIVATWGRADVVFANNVLAHVPDPNEIIAGIATILNDDGIAHIEAPSIRAMIEKCAFDTIYHEHQCYFSLSALKTLIHRHGLRLVDVELMEIHGGSFHVQIARRGEESKALRTCEQEREAGLFEDSFYDGFTHRVVKLRRCLEKTLARFKRVAAYGAAAKGVILFNAFELNVDRIAWVADVSPHKQGRFIPGTRQAIVAPEMLLRDQPEAVLLLPWNIKGEILSQNAEYRRRGGRFIVAVPEVIIY